jgi:hypothetical protein
MLLNSMCFEAETIPGTALAKTYLQARNIGPIKNCS